MQNFGPIHFYFIKLKLFSFLIARYPTDSLRGSVLTLRARPTGRVWVSKSLEPFQYQLGFSNFFLLQNVLSPEGRCVYASPVRVQLFLLMFYLVQEEVPGVQKPIGFIAFFLRENVLSPGGGSKKGPLRVPNLRSFCFISLQGTFF